MRKPHIASAEEKRIAAERSRSHRHAARKIRPVGSPSPILDRTMLRERISRAIDVVLATEPERIVLIAGRDFGMKLAQYRGLIKN